MISLVIPVAEERHNLTLPLALESAQRHMPQVVPVLIGQPMIQRYFPGEPGGYLPFIQNHADPIANTTEMLELACYSDNEAVSDPFIWSYDDVFWLQPTTLAQISREAAYARGLLQTQPPTDVYGQRAHRSIDILEKEGRPTWNYERHVPLLVRKQEMLQALALGRDGAPRSIYQNLQYDDPAGLKDDVKVWEVAGLLPAVLAQPFFSVADGFPLAPLREALAGSKRVTS
jgi:hypothetical protein